MPKEQVTDTPSVAQGDSNSRTALQRHSNSRRATERCKSQKEITVWGYQKLYSYYCTVRVQDLEEKLYSYEYQPASIVWGMQRQAAAQILATWRANAFLRSRSQSAAAGGSPAVGAAVPPARALGMSTEVGILLDDLD